MLKVCSDRDDTVPLMFAEFGIPQDIISGLLNLKVLGPNLRFSEFEKRCLKNISRTIR